MTTGLTLWIAVSSYNPAPLPFSRLASHTGEPCGRNRSRRSRAGPDLVQNQRPVQGRQGATWTQLSPIPHTGHSTRRSASHVNDLYRIDLTMGCHRKCHLLVSLRIAHGCECLTEFTSGHQSSVDYEYRTNHHV